MISGPLSYRVFRETAPGVKTKNFYIQQRFKIIWNFVDRQLFDFSNVTDPLNLTRNRHGKFCSYEPADVNVPKLGISQSEPMSIVMMMMMMMMSSIAGFMVVFAYSKYLIVSSLVRFAVISCSFGSPWVF